MIEIIKGRIKANDDPLKAGRVRIFIPGVMDFKDIEQYPWVTCMNPMPSGIDNGMFIVPEIGDYVLMLGLADHYGSKEYYCLGSWNTSSDKPGDANTVTQKVLYKSVTGHTLFIDDTLGSEKLRLIDRAGQTVEFSAALKSDVGPRGTGNTIDGGAKALTDLVDAAHIKIKDLAGNEWGMQSKTGDTKFWLNHADGNQIVVTSDVVKILSKFGSLLQLEETRVIIKASDDVSITLNLDNGKITFSTNADVDITATGHVNLSGSQVILNNGVGGIHSATNHPIDFFTGSPLSGSPAEKCN